MNTKQLAQLIYNKIFNKYNIMYFPCNITLGNVTITSININSKGHIVLYTSRNHGMPFEMLEKDNNYFNIVKKYIEEL